MNITQDRPVCHTNYYIDELEDSDLKINISKLHKFSKDFVTKNERNGLASNIIRIPVVVHVVYNIAAQNIPDVQILSQIEALNKDYRRLNSDASNVPTEFLPFAADTKIEFALAVRDPFCNPTNGITRTMTSVSQFEEPHQDPFGWTQPQPIKHASQGGHDAWPVDKYLNIWICNVIYRKNDGTIEHTSGYSQFPEGNPSHDGVVINYDSFGTIGNRFPGRMLGRTATHEIGHWLNLKHIWGRNSMCSPDDDEVDDTPRQKAPNSGCPTFPSTVQNCPDTGPNGTMFMNYLDYTDDQCMCMFTAGQTLIMRATMYGPRSSILSSDALIPPYTGAADLWCQDTPYDVGDEPNSISDYFWISEDIWVRNTNDGQVNQEHQNPIYGGQPNYIYVRVRNRSCNQSGSGNVKLYWAKASTSLSWPAPWDGTVTTPALMGGPIGTFNTGNLWPRSTTILEFPWNPPNPNDYSSFGADKTHFCLLSRIETSPTPPYGLIAEGPDLKTNVENNNNIIWKNVSIMGPNARMSRAMGINFSNKRMISNFVFSVPKSEPSVFDVSEIVMHIDKFSLTKWEEGEQQGSGIEIKSKENGEFYIQSGGTLENIHLDPGEIFTMDFEFNFFTEYCNSNQIFNFDVIHAIIEKETKVIGGQRFLIKTMLGTKR